LADSIGYACGGDVLNCGKRASNRALSLDSALP
jgi:hypothetical protein